MGKLFLFLVSFGFIFCGFGQINSTILYKKSDSLFALGLYAECLQERFHILEQVQKEGSCSQLSYSYLQIGRSYYYLHNSAEAKAWLKKSLATARKCQIDSLIGKNLRNIGALFTESGQSDSAISYLNEAGKALHKQDNPAELANLFAIIFEVQMRGLKNFVEARKCLDSCRFYYSQLNDNNQLAFYHIKEGIYHLEMKDCNKAVSYFQKAIELYNTVSSTEGYMYGLSSLASAQEACGNLKESLATLRQHNDLRDKVFKEQTAKNLALYQTRFETQKKEIENLELKSKNQWLILGFGIGFILLIGAGFWFYKYREIVLERRLTVAKREEQRLRFLEVIQAQEKERTRIASELHDGIGHLMAAIKLNSSAIQVSDERNKQILNNTQEIIDQAAKEVRQISHQLMPQSLSELGLLASLNELANRINKGGKIQITVLKNEPIKLDKATEVAVYRIVQEVLNNTLKHANASEFSIDYVLDEHIFTLILKDNGKGFSLEEMEKTIGIGWKNIRSRVELVNGKMDLFSAPNLGVQLEIIIPQKPLI